MVGVALPVGVSLDEARGDEGVWHRRVCHASAERIKQAAHVTRGMKLIKGGLSDLCPACAEGKLKRQKFLPARHRASEKLEEVHTDLIGKMPLCFRQEVARACDCG